MYKKMCISRRLNTNREMMRRLFLLLFPILLTSPIIAQPVDIDRIEPPHWYVGFSKPGVQLMVYGEEIAHTSISVEGEKVRIARISTLDNPNYVWIDLDWNAQTQPGTFEINFKRGRRSVTKKYELKARHNDFKRNQGFDASDAIYLMIPDRFANGDPTNDTVEGMLESANRNDPMGRHGGDLKGIADNLDYIQSLGMTAVWVLPIFENDQTEEYHAYHGYAATDMYRVDRRLGSNEEYLSLVDKVHYKGMKVIMDMIHNHIGDQHWWMKDLPSRDWIHSWEVYGQSNFRGEVQSDPNASKYDFNKLTKGWFVKEMPDLNQKNEYLAKYLIQNTIWWIEYSGIDGIRMDTYVYPDREYMADWVKAVQDEFPRFNIVGEVWVPTAPATAFFAANSLTEDQYYSTLNTLTDFPLNDALRFGAGENTGWASGLTRIYHVLTQDYLYHDPNQNVIFLDNHDVGRFASYVDRNVNKMKRGIGIIATIRGIPQIYYGTEIFMDDRGEGNTDALRRKDFPGGWQGDPINKFTAEGRTEAENEIFEFLKSVFNWRMDKKVIHDGKLLHFVPHDDIYVFARYSHDDLVVVIANDAEQPRGLDLVRYNEILERAEALRDVISGKTYTDYRDIRVEPKGILILEKTN